MADTNKKDETLRRHTDLVPTLPSRENGGVTNKEVINDQNTLLTSSSLKGVMLVQQNFIALPTDILLATYPKCGTTWLKALIFAITNRSFFDFASHPLLTNNPHGCIPTLEGLVQNNNASTTLSLSSARLLATHIPCHLLPASVASSGCRIVYIFRNPKDVFVSWFHMKKLMTVKEEELPPLSLGVDIFCKRVNHFGSYWDHVLGYWNANSEFPGKVLILTYEDMKKDTFSCVKRLAEFLGQPFSSEEERDGVVEEIVKLCSFEHLSNLEVNKTGMLQFTANSAIQNNVFFRKGEVGDWRNHLTDEMAARLNQISEDKFGGTGLMSHIN
ncbi:flavonol 3-sulfotransferase-like [Cornus florida]|uniref:flavonol 3-sulfotransferase-like n=1 Tax=Cornus florida TaxID=4283 RepID=UPI00289C844A|nr:flavonol 3-sulfotransferase-like [Cornus florida]